MINFSQEEILVEGMTTTSIVEGTTSLTQVELERLIDIYPNPTSEEFFIASQNLKIESVRIYSASGSRQSFSKINNTNWEISTEGFSNGIYFVEILTEEGVVVKKLNVMR